MIKGITFMQVTVSPADFDALRRFFAALGFEPGRAWEREDSRGAPFRAPLGEIELYQGASDLAAHLWIEVTGLDDLRRIAEQWLRQNAPKTNLPEANFPEANVIDRLSEIADTFWKSRRFLVEPVPGLRLALWEWADPLRGKPLAVDGDLSATGMRFALVVARWNAVITDRLLQGALDALLRSGAQQRDIEIVRVPGAWEVPSAARALAQSRRFDGIVTLGCLLRGETAHYEAIYTEVARGIGQSQQETGIPHGFGVLTCETLEQALNRAGIKAGNKGFEAAVATIEMISLHRKLGSPAANESRPV